MQTECKIVTKMIAKWTSQETNMNLNLSSTQFSETHLPQARSGLLPKAIEIRSGPEAPGRDGPLGSFRRFLFVFLFVGRLSSEVSSCSGRLPTVFASFFVLWKRTFFRRFFKVVLGRFFIGFRGPLGTHFHSFFSMLFRWKNRLHFGIDFRKPLGGFLGRLTFQN